MSELVQMRQRSPWLWPNFVYYFTPSGREHNRCLNILHAFTNKVRVITSKDFSLAERLEQGENDYIVRKRRRFNTSWGLVAKFSVTCVLNYI